ncbi:type I secretion system permease/ATPase [Pseudoruegeria sp. SHC-113]|uniref:type I secretion system permease/ATPase n=1 Tax=Pseudoruegeria sp. SHC-113 TaxID=2855439 RepID=UPI0021BB7CA4|nr:type I secretion system permease/ATPase [Pseudoruegeria sp. SHC-113]MCT8159111.1 type I secretion system permease/ATPase [Pseudoruegeria sp. SHC-113]
MSQPSREEAGASELAAIRRESRGLYWSSAIFSFFVNLLMLTGPLFMLQVYDRVLGSQSEETLAALFVLVAFLYAMMGVLDFTRTRVFARIGARFQVLLDQRVFQAMLTSQTTGRGAKFGATALQDLESVRRLYSSPAFGAFFDIPWTPIFLVGIFIFHTWLGVLAVVGGGVLIVITILNQLMTRRALVEAASLTHRADRVAEQMRIDSEMVQSLGMRKAAFNRWQGLRQQALEESMHAADFGGGATSMSKTFRLFLQSAMLGLGAYLVLQNELTAGAMIAGSILLGRALAPIEQIVGNWPLVQRAQKGRASLAGLLNEVPVAAPRTQLPRPKARIEVNQATVVPPGEAQASLRMVSFKVEPGQACGVIGPSGAGKTTLARALTGIWPLAGGTIRLDSAALDQYDPDTLGRLIGYLPQKVQLFDGTIAENISRLTPNAKDEDIVSAAQKADAHSMILRLPDGYETQVTANGGRLSGGQVQRIGLARALFGNPVLLVLDEPNSNLDNEGSLALNAAIRAIKADGGAALIMAHRPAAIMECDTLLVLEGGIPKLFGPKDEVLQRTVANAQQIQQSKQSQSAGGVS